MRSPASLLALFLLSAPALGAEGREGALEVGRFGRVTLYGGDSQPSRVVLFVSGDGGWSRGVVDMARALAVEHTLVVGIDIPRYLRNVRASAEACSYFAADFEALSQAVQKQLALPRYEAPVLVGYSSGATLVYAILAQAPPNTFRGAISLGFCPDLALPRPPCRRGVLEFESMGPPAGFVFAPAPELSTPWIALQGEVDQVCDLARTEAFVKRVGKAEVVRLPKVGHGFSVPAHWLPQLRGSAARLAADSSLVGGRRPAPGLVTRVADLPLVELPSVDPSGDLLAIVISGDGGWVGLDREVAGVLAAKGIPVVGLDSLRYFWKRRTPDEAGEALARIAEHYLGAWRRERLLLIGYSRGADVLPFMVTRLSEPLRSRVALVALLGPAREAGFEFHVGDWLGRGPGPQARPILPEVERLRGWPILCVYGQQEADSLCPTLPQGAAILDERPGAHHFGGDYEAIAERILMAARTEPQSR
jgi:type IV secretory pathway VirJ component